VSVVCTGIRGYVTCAWTMDGHESNNKQFKIFLQPKEWKDIDLKAGLIVFHTDLLHTRVKHPQLNLCTYMTI
jgi:hypothetical protein